jgi:hypothetical protein
MNTYYLHDGNESSGPFGLADLKSKNITKGTPVWCEGMADWKKAENVAELKSFFAVVPPPLKSFSTSPISPINKKEANSKILGLSKTSFFIISGFLVLSIGTFIFNSYQENRRTDLDKKNNLTEKNNQQYQLQQKEIEEQKILLAEQEKAEAERIAKERKQAVNILLLENKNTLVDSQISLEEAKNKLIKANNFQLFRTTAERNEEISLIQSDINYWTNKIEESQQEINQLNLELERIP